LLLLVLVLAPVIQQANLPSGKSSNKFAVRKVIQQICRPEGHPTNLSSGKSFNKFAVREVIQQICRPGSHSTNLPSGKSSPTQTTMIKQICNNNRP
jgi:hypothetical protein